MNSGTLYAETAAQEGSLTPAEWAQGHLYLQQTLNGTLGAIRGLSEEQGRFKPAPEQWSILEIVEHIAFVLERVAGPTREALAAAPAPPPHHDCQTIDRIVMHQFPSRLNKYQAPPVAYPVGRFESPAEAESALVKDFEALSEYLDSTPDLREHALEAMPLKVVTNGTYQVMDGYQWILAAAAHTERHTKQILEVKAHQEFPAN